MSGYIDRATGAERLSGYMQAIEEANVKKDDSLIKIGNFKKKVERN